jgi:hypothetical protein
MHLCGMTKQRCIAPGERRATECAQIFRDVANSTATTFFHLLGSIFFWKNQTKSRNRNHRPDTQQTNNHYFYSFTCHPIYSISTMDMLVESKKKVISNAPVITKDTTSTSRGGNAVPSGFILKLYQMVNGAPDEVITVSVFFLR